MATHVFGIRHHGPGSARSLIVALEELKPDVLLIEGPPDAAEVLALAADPAMQAPVALLVYLPDKPAEAVFYPFAQFSPEWQAIQYGLSEKIPVRFMDLPQAHQLGIEQESRSQMGREDPLKLLAEAAGESDGERWWERMVEMRSNSTDVFAAVLEAMTELRSQAETVIDQIELRREAYMRQTIRAAEKEGHERIAVVCGAWHAPVLVNRPAAKDDAAVLKNLPKSKVSATWVPWTHSRLQFVSGYGAGIESPGWYEHLWVSKDSIGERWVSRVARLLREQDLDASPAHVVETVRLAETLSSLRGVANPRLSEYEEAVETVMLFGNRTPLALIHEKLIVGEKLGKVPEATPSIPLQRDLQAAQKRLRLAAEAGQKTLDLDLRKPMDLERSHLLHRLNALDIGWGNMQVASGKLGTFHELWDLRWQPEFAVGIISAAIWGNTVEEAATAKVRDSGVRATTLPELSALIESALLCALDTAMPSLLARLAAESAVAADIKHLMQAVPALVRVQRYGDVRKTRTDQVSAIVHGLITRIAIGLPAACVSLDEAAAIELTGHLDAVNDAVRLIQVEEESTLWRTALMQLADQKDIQGLVAGRANRLLLDAGEIEGEAAARKFALALSLAGDPAQAAAWAEGFLRGSGLLLLHDEKLWAILDNWLQGLKGEAFEQILPLLARTFSAFPAAERRQMGERLRSSSSPVDSSVGSEAAGFDISRAEATLPLLKAIFGRRG